MRHIARSRHSGGAPALLAGVATALLLFAAPQAGAQRPVALGVGGGVTLPRDRLESAAERGYHGLVTLRLGAPLFPVHLRLDALHGQLAGTPGTAENFQISAATASLGYDVVPLAVASVYVVGGAGYYWTRWNGADAARIRDTGWNAGAGIRISLGSVQLFGEARYHSIRTDGGDVHVVPLTVGFIF